MCVVCLPLGVWVPCRDSGGWQDSHKHSRRIYISCVVRHGGHPLQKPLWFKPPGASCWFSHTERQTAPNTHTRAQKHTTNMKLRTSTNTFTLRSLMERAPCTYSLAHQVTWKIHTESHSRKLHTHDREHRQSTAVLEWVCCVDGRGEHTSQILWYCASALWRCEWMWPQQGWQCVCAQIYASDGSFIWLCVYVYVWDKD